MLKRRISTLAIISIIMSISSISFIHAENITEGINTSQEIIEQSSTEQVLEENESIVKVQATKKLNGWVKEQEYGEAIWRYYKDGNMLKEEWLYDGGKWYYLDYFGCMVNWGLFFTNYDEVNDKSYGYYFNEDGSMTTEKGWYYDYNNYTWYYIEEGGLVKSNEWLYENGKWYYLKEYYGMISAETEKINGIYYYFDESGALSTTEGWKEIHRYGEDEWIYSDKDGICKVGWFLNQGKWYYFGEEVNEGNWDIYPQKGSYKIDGKMYYFDEEGVLSYDKGWKKHIYNEDAYDWYYLNGDGTCKTGWFLDNGVWYYWDEEYGYAYNDGVYDVNDIKYYFNEDGSMCTDIGWKKKESYNGYDWYYLNGDGTIKIGWLLDDGNWYYWNTYGYFYKDRNVIIDGIEYRFDENGICLNK